MKKLLSLMLCGLLLFGCSEEYDDSEIKKRLDNLENTRIPSIESQIAAIQTSLPLLQQADTEIKGYITTLQGKVSTLEQSMSDVDVKIKALEYTLQTDFSQRLADVVSQLNAYKQEIQNKIDSFNSSIESLQSADTELEKKISYLDGKIDMQKDWVTATFTTLTQYNGLVADIATIRTNIETINKSITDLETRLNEKIETDIATAVAGLQEEIGQKVIEITDAYTVAIGTAKNEITAAYTSAISSAIDNCIATMKDWVNEKLANYYNIAAIDAKVQLLQNAITDGDKKLDEAIKEKEALLKDAIANSEKALQKAIVDGDVALQKALTEEIERLENKINENYEILSNEISEETARLQKEIDTTNTALETAKTELTEAYTNAIKTAIETNNGLIDKKIADEITTINNRIDTETTTLHDKISSVETRLTTLEQEINDKILALDGRVSDLEDSITALLKRIQSVSYIPRYSDGQAVMKKIVDQDEGIAEFDFMISPKDAVSELEKVWNDAVTMKAVYTQTRSVSFVDLPILDFTADTQNGIITLKVSGRNLDDMYWRGLNGASTVLFISDGNNSIASVYIQMEANLVSDYVIYYTTKDNTPLEPFRENFGANLISNTYTTADKGMMLFDGNVTIIGDSAFDLCNLTSIIIPETVQEIGAGAFSRTDLTSIIIPERVKKIGSSAFFSCSRLTSITIPQNVTFIGACAFYGCWQLASVYCPSVNPPTLGITTSIGPDGETYDFDNFNNNATNRKFYVPTNAVNAYKTAEGWTKYADQIVGYDF